MRIVYELDSNTMVATKIIIHKELCFQLNGILYYIHNRLGRYCSHKQYGDAFEFVLKEQEIDYQREIEVPIELGGKQIKGNRIDFMIKGLVPVDIKTENILPKLIMSR